MHRLTGKPESVAGIEVVPLCDAAGLLKGSLRRPIEKFFPQANPEIWRRLRAEAPEAFGPDGDWLLHFHCFLLRVPNGPTILVDTGLGDTESPAATWAPVPGRLVEALAEAGATPPDIDIVVITHLHSDHASGAVQDGAPAFPNARYLVQQRDIDWVKGKPGNPVMAHSVRPLEEAGCLHTLDGPFSLAPTAEIVPTPGHTPGHQSVVLDGHRLVVSGDAVVHLAHLEDPSLSYVNDEDPDLAARTRAALLDQIRARGGLLASPHMPAPFVRLVRS